MNFKTTIVLIVLLAVAAAALFFTRDSAKEATAPETSETSGDGKKLLPFGSTDVTRLTVKPTDGETITVEKTDGAWKIVEPVKAPGDAFTIDSLVSAVANLETRGAAPASEDMGLSKPAYSIEIKAKDDKVAKLIVGNKSAVGDLLYVGLDGETNKANIVSASLIEQLEKPVSDYRRKQLVEMASADVKQIEVQRRDSKIVLQRTGTDWQMTEPTKMPADTNSVTDLISAATGARAEEFVSESAADAAKFQLDQPQVSVTLSSAPVATQPATSPASQPATATRTLKFGTFADVNKKNIYASVSDSDSIVAVPATTIEKFVVSPITLRDRKAVDIDPQQASQVTIQSDLAATTQPTTRPASQKTLTLDRRKEAVAAGPASPTTASTAPSTQAASAPATTAPAPSKWQIASTTQPTDASDTRVEQILSALHPLRATKYLDAAPTTPPTATYMVTVTTVAAGGAAPQQVVVKVIDRGTSESPIAEVNGLVFEVDRSLLSKLEGEFTKGAEPAAPEQPALPPGVQGIPGLE